MFIRAPITGVRGITILMAGNKSPPEKVVKGCLGVATLESSRRRRAARKRLRECFLPGMPRRVSGIKETDKAASCGRGRPQRNKQREVGAGHVLRCTSLFLARSDSRGLINDCYRTRQPGIALGCPLKFLVSKCGFRRGLQCCGLRHPNTWFSLSPSRWQSSV
jgi:hypothetical protein